MNRVLQLLIVGLFVFSTSHAASACLCDEVVLSIGGKIASSEPVEYTLSQLEGFKTAKITTKTPWDNQKVTFEGVLLSDLMVAVGALGSRLHVVALNSYAAEIPMKDLAKYGVLLSYKKNGKYMKISDKGPLYVMYPFDSYKALDSDAYYSRAVWQVRSITVE